jgi:chromosome segregation protein
MKLKSLHIKGFKSFANDTLLNFSEDVIGIVGPNGSGKSNIVDAIRWVLGEQKSRELRLEAMSDIIFNGTKNKKESATATVTLTFENNKGILPLAYQTVSISRTLYRSGESEYRLNNVPCRLKDINSLFIDTGIGSNSYAIIALGMVDDILSDKENSRRRMFEQAAGISKYKIRKRETFNKLKSATEDLNRVEDLLFEIEGNLKSLEKQAKRTQKYLDYKEEYKAISIRHASVSIQHLKQKYKGIQEELNRQQDEYRKNDARQILLQSNIEKEKKQNLDKENALTDHQKKLNELVHRIRGLEGEKGLITQKIGFKQQNKVQLTKSIEDNKKDLDRTVSELETVGTRLAEEQITLATIQQSLAISREKYDSIKAAYNVAKTGFDTRQKEKQELERQIFNLEKNVAIYRNNIENNQQEEVRIREVQAGREKETAGLASLNTQYVNDIAQTEGQLQQILASEETRKKNIAEQEQQRDALQEKINIVNRELDAARHEAALLKDIIESYEGFPESMRFLHEQWKKNLVVLSDILDVTDEYRAAIELYLEPYLNYFVVKNIQEAMQGIQLLKNSQKGKANFILLDKLPAVKAKKGNVADLIPAFSVVKTHADYKHLIETLLNGVYISEKELGILPDEHDDITIISASGTVVRQGFKLSGGSVGLFEGKTIGRKQQLEKLQNRVEQKEKQSIELSASLENIKGTLAQLKSVNQGKDIESKQKALTQLKQEQIKMVHQLDTFQTWKEENQLKLKKLHDITRDMTSHISLNEQQIQALRNKISELDSTTGNSDNDIDMISQSMSAASEKFNQDNISLIRHQNLIENLNKDREYKQLKFSELTTKIENDQQKLLTEERERIDLEDSIIKLDNSLHQFYGEKTTFQSTLSEAEQVFLKARNTVSELEEELKKLNKVQSQLQHSIQLLKDQFSDQKFQIQSIAERLRIEFNISVNDIPQAQTAGEDNENPDVLNDALEKARARIQSFGDINPLALEAFNEMKIRYDSISLQRKDILDAKDSLMDTIKEIESTATEQFLQAFEKIRTNFRDVFRSLFTADDTCDLLLTDARDPLESEIEIIAKPKGKKPKSLNQLSGGEKTLTATALLFALYLLKPAPFCIFDEVDAPLDDANIQKFNKIIQKFSKDSQFIIVTHNKETMAEVKVLYGVYMIEPGVSAVSPVDFRSMKHEPILENLN